MLYIYSICIIDVYRYISMHLLCMYVLYVLFVLGGSSHIIHLPSGMIQ